LTVAEDNIFSGAFAAAFYLHDLKYQRKIYCAGEPGLAAELAAVGLDVVKDVHTDRMPTTHEDSFYPDLLPPDDVGAVVIGFNSRFNYRVLAYAHHVLYRKPHNLFIATNTDAQYPAAARLWPGTGALVAALECCTERKATVLGKPHTLLVDMIDKK
jgi:ribonucleotide monophosphatase NagD (HAD superfamily)